MNRSRRPRHPVSRLLAVAVLSGAVLGLVPATSASAAVPTTAPAPWAKAVCGGLDGWVTRVSAASKKAAKATPTTTAAAKKRLTALLTATAAQTTKLRKALAKAGKPDVAGGKQIAATIKEGFRQVDSSVKGAKQSLAAASPSDPAAFTAAARATQDALESGLESIQAAFSAARDADAAPLLAAFEQQSTCQKVTA